MRRGRRRGRWRGRRRERRKEEGKEEENEEGVGGVKVSAICINEILIPGW